MTTATELEMYRARVEEMSHTDLIDALVGASISNRYGSHADDIKVLRAEMLKRMTHYQTH